MIIFANQLRFHSTKLYVIENNVFKCSNIMFVVIVQRKTKVQKPYVSCEQKTADYFKRFDLFPSILNYFKNLLFHYKKFMVVIFQLYIILFKTNP